MNLSSYIARVLADNGIISKSDEDVCRYGMEVFFASVFDVLAVLVLSVFLHNFLNLVLFFISFLSLRIYAGGYHADTKLRCFLIMVFVYVLFTFVLRYTHYRFYFAIEVSAMLITSAMVMSFAPIIHRNKSSNDKERCLYRKVSIVVLAVQLLVIVSAMAVDCMSKYVLSFTLGQLAVSLSMMAALVKQKLQRRCK